MLFNKVGSKNKTRQKLDKVASLATFSTWPYANSPNAALRCERRLAILERSEIAKRCESLLNALLCL